MPTTTEEFEILLLLASAWVEECERAVLRDGVLLDEVQVNDALAAGVAHPKRVRLLKVPQVPLPEHPALLKLCESTRAITLHTRSLSARYGILVKADHWGERELIVHELVHTSQFERLGGIRPFLQQYLQECLTVGYPQGPMEQEAILTASKICALRPP
jgi:hypothetical protein